MCSNRLDAALRYAALGWSVIPTVPRGKKAAGMWKPYQACAADAAQLRKWYGNGHDYGVAVVLGAVSGGLACRDFDVVDSYRQWASEHRDLAQSLPTVTTARGAHVYFRAGAADLVFADLGDGEYRGDSGHYCVLPPSVHPTGVKYEWQVPLAGDGVPFVQDVRSAGLLTTGCCYTESARDELDVCTVSSVSSVYQGELQERIDGLLASCLPTGPGKRHRQVFELARAIKSVPELANANPNDLRPIVERWYALALPHIRTTDFTETWIDFIQAWPKVKVPKGETMALVMQRALNRPIPKAAERYDEGTIRMLVALCRELERTAKDGTFFLSCRIAGELLGVTHTQANRWLFLLDHDGVIKQLDKGDTSRRQAARYRYLGD